MKTFNFKASLWLPRGRSEIFEFFSSALNLEKITPPWVQFHVTTPAPIRMCAGTEIDYRLKLHGIPIGWRSKITVWEPPYRFVDEQVRGPYRRWIHEHRFSEEGEGTRCEDFLQYSTWGGALINRLVVERDIRRIFAFRAEQLQKLLTTSLEQQDEVH